MKTTERVFLVQFLDIEVNTNPITQRKQNSSVVIIEHFDLTVRWD